MAVCYSLRSRHQGLFSCCPKVDYFPDSYYNVSVNDLLAYKSLVSDYFFGLDSYQWGYQVKGQNTFKSLDGLFAKCFPESRKNRKPALAFPTFSGTSIIFRFF